MALDLLIHAATEAVLDYLIVEAGEGHTLDDYLAHDPDKRALQIALARTLHDFTQRHPEWIRDLLSGSALTGATAQTIGNLLRGAPAPQGDVLARTWVGYWNDVVTHDTFPDPDELAPIANDFVEILTAHLSAQPFLWSVLIRAHHHPASHTVPLNTELAIAVGVFEAALREAQIPLRFIGEQEVRTLSEGLHIPEDPAAYGIASTSGDLWDQAYQGLSAEDQRRFRQLGRLPADQPISLSVLEAIWQVESWQEAQGYVDTLHEAGLLSHAPDGNGYQLPLGLSVYADALLEGTDEAEAVAERTKAALAS